MESILETSIEGPVHYIKLNRPEKRNALSDLMLLEIEKVFRSLPPAVRCVVLYGEGDHFSAGLDLSELQERDTLEGYRHSRMWHRVMDAVEFCGVPVLAVLHGACVGGGLELACACHIRIADASVFYALPEGQRGIFTGGGGALRLPRLVGTAVMTDMMLTGRVHKAEAGDRLGFSQYLTGEGKGLETARELAEKISANAPMTNFALTQVLPRIAHLDRDAGLSLEALMAAVAQSAPEAKQRLRDFLEGRAKKVGEE